MALTSRNLNFLMKQESMKIGQWEEESTLMMKDGKNF